MTTASPTVRTAGLDRFTRARKEDSRRRLTEAAERLFASRGYFATSVDDISREAGVTRQTFYRHYDGKFAIAMSFFERVHASANEIWGSLGTRDYRDLETARLWIEELCDFYQARGLFLRIFVEMSMAEPSFRQRLDTIAPEMIRQLGEHIPAFRVKRGERAWSEAWLLVHLITEQCSAAATGFTQIDRSMLIELLAEKLHAFILDAEAAKSAGRSRKAPAA